MIGYLRGKVTYLLTDYCLLDVQGVGYRVFVAGSTRNQLRLGEEATLFTYLNVREDAMLLYGFYSQQEYDLFQLLISVSGVGPKVALGILSAITVEGLCRAIQQKQAAVLTKLPGIGKKSAERLILELKDKVEQQDVSAPAGSAAPVSPVVGDAQREAQAALQALGYTSAEAARAINLVRDQADTVDALIMLALRQIGSL